MIIIQQVVSDYSELPLAQIRSDGNKIEWIDDVDKLESVVGENYDKLKEFIDMHPHLSLVEVEKPITIRHITLDNKDTASITDDGKTVYLNGKLLTLSQKNKLQEMLDSGAVKTTGLGAPQIIYKPKQAPKTDESDSKDSYKQYFEQKKVEEESKINTNQSYYEDEDLDQIQDSFTRNLGYYMKYGKFKGGRDA